MGRLLRHPFDGIGDPEPLKHNWSGYWTRRIDREHRIVYKATDDALYMEFFNLGLGFFSKWYKLFHLKIR